jgi:hypothetical protein
LSWKGGFCIGEFGILMPFDVINDWGCRKIAPEGVDGSEYIVLGVEGSLGCREPELEKTIDFRHKAKVIAEDVGEGDLV